MHDGVGLAGMGPVAGSVEVEEEERPAPRYHHLNGFGSLHFEEFQYHGDDMPGSRGWRRRGRHGCGKKRGDETSQSRKRISQRVPGDGDRLQKQGPKCRYASPLD